jgi:hypothetical protein
VRCPKCGLDQVLGADDGSAAQQRAAEERLRQVELAQQAKWQRLREEERAWEDEDRRFSAWFESYCEPRRGADGRVIHSPEELAEFYRAMRRAGFEGLADSVEREQTPPGLDAERTS